MSFITVSSRLGLENQPTPSGAQQELRGAGSEWGIDDTGPYLSPSGAAVNENAVLSLDPDGIPVLTVRRDEHGNVFLVRLDGRLHPGVRDRVILVGSDGSRQVDRDRQPDGSLLAAPVVTPVRARVYTTTVAASPEPSGRAYVRQPDGTLLAEQPTRPALARMYTRPAAATAGLPGRVYQRQRDGRLLPHTVSRPARTRTYRSRPTTAAERAPAARIYPRHMPPTAARPSDRPYDRLTTGRMMIHPPIHAPREDRP